MEKITVVCIGPDAPGMLTLQAAEALKGAGAVLMRTGQHGVARWLEENGIAYQTLDALYESADDFDTLNAKAAQAVTLAAETCDALCYAVPDPTTDATVQALVASGIQLAIITGVTQQNTASAAALAAGLPVSGQIITMPAVDLRKEDINPALPLLLTELHSRLLAGEVKLLLLDVYAPETQVLFGTAIIPLDSLDRQVKYSHLSSVYIPDSPMTARARYTFGDLLDVMAQLRKPQGGCPWDIEQTHESLRESMIEEAYELVDAIDQGDMMHVADELGDVLLQVAFHAQIAKEHSDFDITDVTTAICHKMITRHAHIFGDIVCETSEDVIRSWEEIKKKEKGLRSTTEVMQDVPGHLPALMRAGKVQKKARQVGFDWDSPIDALAKVHEEADEVLAELQAGADPEMELGDLLFATVNAARLAGVQPELALSAATEKFIRRFSKMEAKVLAEGKQLKGMTLPEMDAYWDAVKHEEKENP